MEHWYEYSCHKAYADSKLLIVAASNMLDRRLREEERPVLVCSLHPGVVRTNLFQHVSAIHRVTLKLAIERWAYLVSFNLALKHRHCNVAKHINVFIIIN